MKLLTVIVKASKFVGTIKNTEGSLGHYWNKNNPEEPFNTEEINRQIEDLVAKGLIIIVGGTILKPTKVGIAEAEAELSEAENLYTVNAFIEKYPFLNNIEEEISKKIEPLVYSALKDINSFNKEVQLNLSREKETLEWLTEVFEGPKKSKGERAHNTDPRRLEAEVFSLIQDGLPFESIPKTIYDSGVFSELSLEKIKILCNLAKTNMTNPTKTHHMENITYHIVKKSSSPIAYSLISKTITKGGYFTGETLDEKEVNQNLGYTTDHWKKWGILDQDTDGRYFLK
jgi:hypothetical protein